MKLRYSPTSPYVRKVSITGIEAGLSDRIENVPTDVWSDETDIGVANPVGRVPALVTDDGEILYDSPVICEYLNELGGGSLYPAGAGRWSALRRQALADGMLDAGVLLLGETMRRPEELRWDWWIDRYRSAVLRCIAALDAEADGMATGDDITIGEVTVVCGMDWVDLRFPDLGWRTNNPALADWLDAVSDRQSFQATVPKP